MPSGIKICKICGKEYPYCHTVTNDKFRWQDVACCKEHAIEYFSIIEASRAGGAAPDTKVEKEEIKEVETTSVKEAEEPHVVASVERKFERRNSFYKNKR